MIQKLIPFFILLTIGTYASEKPKQEISEPIRLEIQLRDKTFLIGELEVKEINLKTPHGNLMIELQYISRIEFGLKASTKVRNKIKELIKNLNSTDEETSLDAERKILDIGLEALPILYKEDDKNGSEKIANIILELETMNGAESYIGEMDKIILNDESTFTGEILLENLQIKTLYGILKFTKEQAASIQFINEGKPGLSFRKQFLLPANTYISANNATGGGYLNTKIFVKKGETIEIKATGEITLASLSNLKVTPEGNPSQGSWMNIPFGGLAGKIGNNGTLFLIGKKYKAIAKESGYLFLTISETVFNNTNTGEYKVSIYK